MSDQARKLFEALSGVDEELLERCNCEKTGKIVYMSSLWKYRKTMAACACLLAVGALSFGGYQLLGERTGSSGSGSDLTAPAQISDMATPMETRAGAASGDVEAASQVTEPEEAKTEGTGSVQSQVTADEGAENDAIRNNAGKFSELKDNDVTSSVGESLSGSGDRSSAIDNLQNSMLHNGTAEKSDAQMDKEMASTDSRGEIPWNTACKAEPFGNYIPTVIPAGYEPLSARQSSMPNEWNNMIFKWGNGEQTLCLNMTVGEAKTKGEIKAEIEKSDGLYQYPAEDFRKEMIPESMVDGKIAFTLYYSDGMRIDFSGSITEDEMWELVKSISK